jgi:hypothetical protein
VGVAQLEMTAECNLKQAYKGDLPDAGNMVEIIRFTLH